MSDVMRRAPGAGALVLATGLFACGSPASPSGADAGGTPEPAAPAAPASVSSTFEQQAVAHGVVALSSDDQGVPRFVRAVKKLPGIPGKPEDAARAHLAKLAPAYIASGSPAQLELEAVHAPCG